jgi:hypothetical protein
LDFAGIENTTLFKGTAENWTTPEEDYPLVYAWMYTRSNNQIKMKSKGEKNEADFYLPRGSIQVQCDVCDSVVSCASDTVTAIVSKMSTEAAKKATGTYSPTPTDDETSIPEHIATQAATVFDTSTAETDEEKASLIET